VIPGTYSMLRLIIVNRWSKNTEMPGTDSMLRSILVNRWNIITDSRDRFNESIITCKPLEQNANFQSLNEFGFCIASVVPLNKKYVYFLWGKLYCLCSTIKQKYGHVYEVNLSSVISDLRNLRTFLAEMEKHTCVHMCSVAMPKSSISRDPWWGAHNVA
jgi:hypothetical protein